MKINRAKNPDSMIDFEKKHTPFIEKVSRKIIVSVGTEIEHPMNPEHYITWIELLLNGESLGVKELDNEDPPSATFELDKEPFPSDEIKARANCNLHGTWESF
ncbi:MAG: hypothetical protein JW716_04490 [Candidatus Aenigmarchaeota archaeon]|nr:hypothetical protein [Candidatus Aenigmarchaeota archaeon]